MAIPLALLLIPYFAIVAIGGLFLVFNLYDMGKFGLQSGKTSFLMALYVLAFLVVLAIAGADLLTTDWTQSIAIPNFISTGSNPFTFGL